MLKKFGLNDSKSTKTPMLTEIKLTKDDEADSMDNSNIETTHLEAIKHIFRYIRGTSHLGLWYPKGIGIETIVYADSNYAGDYVDRKSTSGVCICIYSDAWGLDELEKALEKIKPYNSRLPAFDDTQNLIHRRTIHEKIDKEGNTIHKFPNQIETNELFDHLRPCKLVIRENVYSAIGNKDHTQAVIALMFYCLENRQPFNLTYFIIRRMYFFRDRRDEVLPYGMILTRLFKNLKANMAQGLFDERYKLVPRKMSSLKAKQPKNPPPKRASNVGKYKRTQLSTSSSTESPPTDN
nr:hypothetical protein [Tanacetum cinerariifolium]